MAIKCLFTLSNTRTTKKLCAILFTVICISTFTRSYKKTQDTRSQATTVFHNVTIGSSNDIVKKPQQIEVSSTVAKIISAKRIVVTSYLPRGETSVLQFTLFLFSSWEFVTEHETDYYTPDNAKDFRKIDLLAFCHPEVCPKLPKRCKKYDASKVLQNELTHCWFVEQTFESKIKYGPVNSYVMFNRTDAEDIFRPYERILRTDYDVFITPMLLTWKLRKTIIFGQGGYCDPFNMKRLIDISTRKLGMRHQAVHCIGSTWYGETDIFIKCCRKAYEMTEYMFLNEFDPKLPGLEVIPFDKNIEGEWIRWWRPVSSMYGGEMAANHVVDNLTLAHKGTFDTSSCSKQTFRSTPHIHCWHDACDFQKFSFMNNILAAIHSRDKLPGEVVHRLVENSFDKDIQNMSVREYSNFIAWGGVRKYLKTWFV